MSVETRALPNQRLPGRSSMKPRANPTPPIARLTTVRLAVLAILAAEPRDGVRPVYIADTVAPRRRGWTPQSATRWVGSLLRPLLEAGLVRKAPNADGLLFWEITALGRQRLRTGSHRDPI
jgi:hypothetical protein